MKAEGAAVIASAIPINYGQVCPLVYTARIVFLLMIDGSGSRVCRIFGRLKKAAG
jgi:hypothetical protein